jgi:prevent-host-death family protein
MASYSITELRANVRKVLSIAQTEDVTITNHGKPVRMLLSAERYFELLAAYEQMKQLNSPTGNSVLEQAFSNLVIEEFHIRARNSAGEIETLAWHNDATN